MKIIVYSIAVPVLIMIAAYLTFDETPWLRTASKHAGKAKIVKIETRNNKSFNLAEEDRIEEDRIEEASSEHNPVLVPSIKTGDSLLDEIREAFDNDDLKTLSRLVPQVLLAKNDEVKEEMIGALEWFDKKALPDLIPFLGDPSVEIREQAVSAVSDALDDCEDIEKAENIAIIMKSKAVTSDSEMEDYAMELNMINDNRIIIKTVVDIMENGKSDLGKKWANDTYEFVTGEDYSDSKTAEEWIIENCDEDDE